MRMDYLVTIDVLRRDGRSHMRPHQVMSRYLVWYIDENDLYGPKCSNRNLFKPMHQPRVRVSRPESMGMTSLRWPVRSVMPSLLGEPSLLGVPSLCARKAQPPTSDLVCLDPTLLSCLLFLPRDLKGILVFVNDQKIFVHCHTLCTRLLNILL